MPAMIHLDLDNCDATYERALAGGRDVGARSPMYEFDGGRRQGVAHWTGNLWWASGNARRGRAGGRDGEAHLRALRGAGEPSEGEGAGPEGRQVRPSEVEDDRGEGYGLGGYGGGKAPGRWRRPDRHRRPRPRPRDPEPGRRAARRPGLAGCTRQSAWAIHLFSCPHRSAHWG